MPALAFARGEEDGSSRENSFTTYVFEQDDSRVDFHAWNVYDEEEGWQLHCDIDVSYVNGPEAFIGGLCLGQPEDELAYDCIAFASFVELDRLGDEGYGQEVSILDSYQTDGAKLAEYKNDASVETVPEGSIEYNWVEIPSYTWKACEKGFEDD